MLEAKEEKGELTYGDIVATMKAICEHRDLPQVEAQPTQQKTATV